MTHSAPNTFLVGAPKCGTTAMSEYLGSHPGVFMSDPKEPHFFGSDMRAYGSCNDLPEYLQLFAAADSARVIMEASVLYLYSEDAVSNILRFCPEAKFIVMLRHTADYLHAFHSQLLLNTDEWISDFASAWEASKNGRRTPPAGHHSRIPKLLDYPAVGRLGEQVSRLLDKVPAERVHFIFFEDFAADTHGEYRRLLEFLELADDGRSEFPAIHSNKANRWRWLAEMRAKPAGPTTRAWGALKTALGLEQLSATGWLHRLNRRQRARDTLPDQLRAELLAFFSDDIALLSAATGKSLNHWYTQSNRQLEASPS